MKFPFRSSRPKNSKDDSSTIYSEISTIDAGTAPSHRSPSPVQSPPKKLQRPPGLASPQGSHGPQQWQPYPTHSPSPYPQNPMNSPYPPPPQQAPYGYPPPHSHHLPYNSPPPNPQYPPPALHLHHTPTPNLSPTHPLNSLTPNIHRPTPGPSPSTPPVPPPPWTPHVPYVPSPDLDYASVPVYEFPPPDMLDMDMSDICWQRMQPGWTRWQEYRYWEEMRRAKNAAMREQWAGGRDREEGCVVM